MNITIAGIVIISFISGCSEKSTDYPRNYVNGEIIFRNDCTYTIIVNRIVQSHEGETMSEDLDQILFPSSSFRLINLFDGELIFPGGDRITIDYRSQAADPNDPQSPLFSHSVFLTVNGSIIIRVKGEGYYEIGGN